MKLVQRRFLARDPREVAPELLGKVLAHDLPWLPADNQDRSTT